MSRRLKRVERELRRLIADIVLFGGLRDPRLQPTASISITGIKVTADLGSARIYIDVAEHKLDARGVAKLLDHGTAEIRRELARKIHLKRVPKLSFHPDESIQQGARIEQIVRELQDAEPDSEAE